MRDVYRLSFYSLSLIVSADPQDPSACGVDAGAMAIIGQAFQELEKWTVKCQGHPRRWDEYQDWPCRVSPEFLDLLALGDEITLLIFTHWSAVMARSDKPFVRVWARRAGMSAIHRLGSQWSEQLKWPLDVLAPRLRVENMGSTQLSLKHPTETGPEQVLPDPLPLQLPTYAQRETETASRSTDALVGPVFPIAQGGVLGLEFLSSSSSG